MELNEKTVKSERIFDGTLLHVRRDTVKLPNGKESTREIVEHPGAVCILPITTSGEVILVRQYRKPVERVLWELPAGKLDPGEAPLTCAARELWEETGYRGESFELLTSIFTTPGFSDEVIHLYLAEGVANAGGTSEEAAAPDEDEFVEVKRVGSQRAIEMIRSGEIVDAKSICALFLWRLRLETAR